MVAALAVQVVQEKRGHAILTHNVGWAMRLRVIPEFIQHLRARFKALVHRTDYLDPEDEVPEEVLAFARQSESEGNAASTPHDEEHIRVRCLWAVEYYSASYIDDLLDNLRKLGWLSARGMFEAEDPASWLARSRRDSTGGWKSVGYLVSEGTVVDLPGEAGTARLPAGVDSAYLTMGLITPSLVTVAVCFTFDDEQSGVLEDALRTDRQTCTKKTRRGWEHYQPESQKFNHIRQIRHDLVRMATDWFSENLPGVFSSGQLDREVPTCEFLTFRKADPIPSQHEDDDIVRFYLMMLGVYWDTDIWVMANCTGVKFSFPHSVFFGPPNHCVLTTSESEIGSGNPHHFGDQQTMQTILCAWGILALLGSYEARLRKLRDSVSSASKQPQDITNVLDEMVASDSIDIMAVVTELASASSRGLRLFGPMTRMEPRRPNLARVESLKDLFRDATRNGAIGLKEIERATSDRLTQFGSLVGARENVRLQRKITTLTWVLVGIGAVSVVLVALSLLDASSWFGMGPMD